MQDKLPRFISASLTEDSRKLLASDIEIPKYSKLFMHHITLAYNPTLDEYNCVVHTVKDGDIIDVVCLRRYWDDGVEAITVSLTNNKQEVCCVNKNPHITISTENKPPKLSNNMLNKKDNIPPNQQESMNNLKLQAIVKYEE